MTRSLRIRIHLEERAFRLRSHGVEACLEGLEVFVYVLGSDGDGDVETDAVEGVGFLELGGHGVCMGVFSDVELVVCENGGEGGLLERDGLFEKTGT